MKKPIFLRSLGIVVLIAIVIGGFLLLQQRNSSLDQEQQQEIVAVEKVPSQTTKTYTDEAGFQFDYPDDLIVNKKESTNSAIYSNIELTSRQAAGSLAFLVEDTKEKTIDLWVKKNISLTPSATKEVSLGSLSAEEIIINGNFLTVAIDQGILFRLDVSSQEENKYWQSVYNTVLFSFSFAAPESVAAPESSGGGEEVILEEDVIE